MRVLEMVFPTISREDATEVLRRTRMSAESVESESVAEQIRTRAKIHFRTKYMSLLAKVYDEIGEDRSRASVYVDELLNAGPDMALEMFKDVGRGYYIHSMHLTYLSNEPRAHLSNTDQSHADR